jgi:hypothetical protein
MSTYRGWAITLPVLAKPGDAPPLAGVYYFTERCEDYHDGIRTAVFATREKARAAARSRHRAMFAVANVVPVTVTITVQRPKRSTSERITEDASA